MRGKLLTIIIPSEFSKTGNSFFTSNELSTAAHIDQLGEKIEPCTLIGFKRVK